jgi:hypothetical protein
VAGATELCLAFKAWTLGRAKKFALPDKDEDDKVEALQLSPKGLFLYVGGGGPDPVKEGCYGIGSGGGYGVGALSVGATIRQAMDVAAKWDANTRAPFDVITLESLKGRR